MSEQLQNHLRNHPDEWEFLQVVRALERLSRGGRSRSGDASREPREGGGRRADAGPAGSDRGKRPPPVRFRTSPSMAFPTCEVESIASRDERVGATDEVARVWEVAVNFLGLHGATGAMPRSDIGEALYLAGSPNNKSILALFDLLGSPFIRLFGEAMRKYRAPLQWERRAVADGEVRPGDDPLEHAMLALVGGGSAEFRSAEGPRFQLRQLLRLGSAFASPHRTAIGLTDVLRTLLDVPVTVEQFQPVWREIPEEDRSLSGGKYAVLGRNAVSGSRFCDVASGVLITVGPIHLSLFLALLPSGTLHGRLADLVAMYAGHHLRCKLRPILHKDDVPGSRIGSQAYPPSMLGRSSWLAARKRTEHYDGTIVSLSPFDLDGLREEG